MKKLVNVRLDADLWHEVRVAATKADIQIQEWVALALRHELDRPRKKEGER